MCILGCEFYWTLHSLTLSKSSLKNCHLGRFVVKKGPIVSRNRKRFLWKMYLDSFLWIYFHFLPMCSLGSAFYWAVHSLNLGISCSKNCHLGRFIARKWPIVSRNQKRFFVDNYWPMCSLGCAFYSAHFCKFTMFLHNKLYKKSILEDSLRENNLSFQESEGGFCGQHI